MTMLFLRASLVRIGKAADSQNRLTGEWSTMREFNGRKYPARVLFFSDGRVLWITILREEHGRYSVPGNKIRLEISGRPVVEGRFAVTDTRLTLPNPKGGESSFERF